jgi:AraC family transcriptional regulator, regulatory protein of adaptative response / DNA-3-methyladenine glycosylase II
LPRQPAGAALGIGGVQPSPDGGLTRTFPNPAAIAAAEVAVPAARANTVRELAQRLATGELRLDEGADREAIRRGLLAVPGLGPAQVEDLMLHALDDPDAFPVAGPGLRSAARAHGLPADTAGLTRRANRWRPWRGYGPTCCGEPGRSSRRGG